MIAFDYSSRVPGLYGFIMIMFCTFHIIVTLILATLIKGMVWSAYLAVSKQYEVNKQEECAQREINERNQSRHRQIEELEELGFKMESMKLDTLVKREVY